MYPSETYIDKPKVLGIKQVSFEFRSEDCGRQIFVFQVCWKCVPCSRSRDRKPTRAESLGECSRYDEITTSCRTMRSQRTTVRYKREHLREVWRGFTAQAAENKQTKFERDGVNQLRIKEEMLEFGNNFSRSRISASVPTCDKINSNFKTCAFKLKWK